MDKQGKIKLANVSKFIRHKVKKPIYKITTRTGKVIKVTGDHSLFGLRENAEISEIKVNEIKEISLIDHLEKFDNGYIFGDCVKEFLKNNKFEIHQLGKEHKHNRSLRC